MCGELERERIRERMRMRERETERERMRKRERERERKKREQLEDNQSLIFLGYFIKWNGKVKLLYANVNFLVLSYLKRESKEINNKICIQYYIFFVQSLVVSEIFGFCAKKVIQMFSIP